MAYDIGPRIGIEGEAEFRRELQSISTGLKTLGTEMNVVTSAYAGNENSVEALTAKNDVLDRTILSLNEKLEAQQRMLQESAAAYGEADQRTQKWQQAVNRTTAELNKAQAQVNANSEAIANSNSLVKTISNSLTGKLGNALGLSSDQMKQLTGALREGGGGMSSLLSSSEMTMLGLTSFAAIAAKTTSELLKMTQAAAQSADEVLTMSTNYGVAAADLQKLQYMSELTDVSVQTVTDSMSKLVRSMDSARGGTGDAAEAFAALGVQVTDASGQLRSSSDVFMETIDALARVQNGTERDAEAMAIFGRGAQKLNGIIAIGSEGLRQFAAEAENSGYVMSDKMLSVLHDADDSAQRLDKSVEGLTNTLGVLLAPVVTEINNGLADLASSAANAIQELLGLQDAATALSAKSSFGDLTAADFPSREQQYQTWLQRNQALQQSGPQMTTIIVRNPTTTDNQVVRALTPEIEARTTMQGAVIS